MSVFLSISNYTADLRTQAWVDKSLLANKNHRNWSIAYSTPAARQAKNITKVLKGLPFFILVFIRWQQIPQAIPRAKRIKIGYGNSNWRPFTGIYRSLYPNFLVFQRSGRRRHTLLGFELLQSCATLLLMFFRGKILRNTVGSKFSFDTRKLSEKHLRQKT